MVILRLLLILCIVMAAYVVAMLVLFVPYGWALPLIVVVAVVARRRNAWTAYGTARWADYSDVRSMLDGNGLIVGRISGRPTLLEGLKALFDRKLSAQDAVRQFLIPCQGAWYKHENLLRLTNAVHTAVFAPSGAGKNVSIVEPFLLTCDENVICIDVKGENAEITGPHRAEAFGHKVVLIDPFRVVTKTPTPLNALASIDPDDPESLDKIRAIAAAVVVKEPNARDPHWSQKAELFITGAISAVVFLCPPQQRSLQEVASIMANKKLLAEAINALKQSPAHSGLLARLGHEMSLSTDKELDGILSTANRSLIFLSTPAVVESTSAAEGFNPAELEGKQGITIYLILPLQYLRSQSGLMRLWITSLMNSVIKGGVHNRRPVHVILDECATLGPLEAIEDMLTIGRGFGLKLTTIFQSMAQLRKVFPEGQDGVLLSNTTQVFFAVNDQQTAEYVSNRLGEETIVIQSGGTSSGVSHQSSQQGGPSSGTNSSLNSNWQQLGRRLLKPEEVCALDPRIAITLAPGFPPIASYLVRYYEKGFGIPRRLGPLKVTFDAFALFALVALFAAWFTAAIFNPSWR